MFLLSIKKRKIKFIISLIFVFLFAVNTFCQEQDKSEKLNRLLGVWENGGRFIEFSDDNIENLKMRIVLKPYYRFVYDDASKINVEYKRVENSKSQFYLRYKYALTRNSLVIPVCVENNSLFTSFYKKVKYTENNKEPNYSERSNSLEGFWIEQGTRKGILLYPNELPESIDAYFFHGNSYTKFRYWLDDLEYNTKKAVMKDNDGNTYEFPKLLKRGAAVYSCITSNGTKLRNFETGIYSIKTIKNSENEERLALTFDKQGAGPGKTASADTYPHQQFIVMENLPLFILDEGQVFAIGEAYLSRSKITNLDEEIKKHNSKRRKKF